MKLYLCFALLLLAQGTTAKDEPQPTGAVTAKPLQTTSTSLQQTTTQPSSPVTPSATATGKTNTGKETVISTSQPSTNPAGPTTSSKPSTSSTRTSPSTPTGTTADSSTTVPPTVTNTSTALVTTTINGNTNTDTATKTGITTATATKTGTTPATQAGTTPATQAGTTAPTTGTTNSDTTSPKTNTATGPEAGTTTATGTNAGTTTATGTNAGTTPSTGTKADTTTATSTKASTTTATGTTTNLPESTATPTPQPSSTSVIISETNLLLATDKFFVELQGEETSVLDNLTLVIKDGISGNNTVQFQYNATDILDNSTWLFVQPVDKDQVDNLVAVAVILYKPDADTTTYEGVQDYVVYASQSVSLNLEIKETLLKRTPLRVVGTKKSRSLTMSRFVNTPQDNTAFVLANDTQSVLNIDDLALSQVKVTLQLRPTSKDLCKIEAQNNKTLNDVRSQLAGIVLDCGLSPQQIVGDLACKGDLFFTFKIKQSYVGQATDFLTGFNNYVQGNQSLSIGGQTYDVINCTQLCRPAGHHLPPKDGKNGNIKVTVAVVLSCIVVFLLILVSVIFYMRRKRRGIMRQFRMTRLQEDDDLDDMDDFMGAIDQEPSFSSSRNNLTN